MPELITICRRVAGDCGERLTELCMSPKRTAVAVITLSLAAGATEYVAHRAIHDVAESSQAHAIANAVVASTVMACFSLIIVAVLRERRHYLVEHMRVVADLNHNVRNALQAIIDSPYLPRSEQTAVIMESVARIDQTLHALFPVIGERSDDGRAAALAKAPTPRRADSPAQPTYGSAVRLTHSVRRSDPPPDPGN